MGKNLLKLLNFKGYYGFHGTKFHHSKSSPYGAVFGEGDEVGVSIDLDKGDLEFYLNGISLGVAFNGVFGPLRFAITLYAPQDKVTINANAKEPSKVIKSSSIGIIKDKESIYFKSIHGTYVNYTTDGSPTASNLNPFCLFTASYDSTSNTFTFTDPNKMNLTAESGSTKFIVSQLSNGYTLQSSKTGKFLGISPDKKLLIYNDSSNNNTRWFPESLDDTDVGKIFKHGEIIAFKKSNHKYFGYNQNGSPIVTETLTDENYFIVGMKEFHLNC
jgi:hypothetical protein